jgi:hypothetical protein
VLQANWFDAQAACCSIGMTLPVLSDAQKLYWMDSLKSGALAALKEQKASLDPSTGVLLYSL